jgi:hypothetical protein
MSNKCIVDTSALIAVIADEVHKPVLISATMDMKLVAPGSVGWEIGNAFSAMFWLVPELLLGNPCLASSSLL